MVAPSGLVVANAKDGTHVLEDTGKGAAGVNNDHAAQTDFEEDVLEKVDG